MRVKNLVGAGGTIPINPLYHNKYYVLRDIANPESSSKVV